MIKSHFPIPGMVKEGGTFKKGNLNPAFRQKREGSRAFPKSTVSQLLSAQNSPYAEVAYFSGHPLISCG